MVKKVLLRTSYMKHSKKLKKTENISIQGFGHLSTADSRPWQKSE